MKYLDHFVGHSYSSLHALLGHKLLYELFVYALVRSLARSLDYPPAQSLLGVDITLMQSRTERTLSGKQEYQRLEFGCSLFYGGLGSFILRACK